MKMAKAKAREAAQLEAETRRLEQRMADAAIFDEVAQDEDSLRDLMEVSKKLDEQDAVLNEQFGDESGEDEHVEGQYCGLCKKRFKNVKQWDNHQKSKKHQSAVTRLRKELEAEDGVLLGGGVQDDEAEAEEAELDDEADGETAEDTGTWHMPGECPTCIITLESKAFSASGGAILCDACGNPPVADDEEMFWCGTCVYKQCTDCFCAADAIFRAPEAPVVDEDVEHLVSGKESTHESSGDDIDVTDSAQPTTDGEAERADPDLEAKREGGDGGGGDQGSASDGEGVTAVDEASGSAPASGSKKASGQRRKQKRQLIKLVKQGKLGKLGEVDGGTTCQVCNAEFGSRSKLFVHIKSTGHATVKDAPASDAWDSDDGPQGGAKGKKKKKKKK
jgi:DnaJ family protein A protein 5